MQAMCWVERHSGSVLGRSPGSCLWFTRQRSIAGRLLSSSCSSGFVVVVGGGGIVADDTVVIVAVVLLLRTALLIFVFIC